MSQIALLRPNTSLRVASLAAATILVAGLLPTTPAAATGLDTVVKIAAALCPTGETGVTAVLTEAVSETTSTLTVADGCIAVLDLDGKELTLQNVVLGAGSTLTITDALNGGGKLVADASADVDLRELAGIQTTDATLVVQRGVVEARGARFGAGIGGSDGDDGGTVRISGGIVTAVGGQSGAGIGGGDEGGDGGTVTISGGIVTATGGSSAAGIGGGNDGGDGGMVTISGGIVTATGTTGGAGIGGGRSGGDGGTVIISGGEVTATGSSSAAGIGGGQNGDGGEVTISGGVVEAIGDGDAAGIGGGTRGDGGVVLITGGTVEARTGTDGPGIGRGDRSSGSWDVRISGGSVTATAGPTGGGAGIGGGDTGSGPGGTVTVSAGTVQAFGGSTGSAGGAGIGAGRQDGDGWSVTITGGSVEATAGWTDADAIGAGSSRQSGTLTVGSAAVRVDAVVGGLPVTRITFPSATTSPTAAGPSFFAPGGVQPLQPVASAAFVRADGSLQQLAASARGRNQVRYEADGIRVTLQGGTGTGVARGLVANPAAEIVCEVCIAGLTSGQVIEVWLFSTPRLVAAHLTDDGECQLFTVPLSAPLDGAGPVSSGAHTLQFTLATSGGLEAVNVGLTVGGLVPSSVPAGEGPALPVAMIAFGLVVLVGIRRLVVVRA
jgi:hypothetical protein